MAAEQFVVGSFAVKRGRRRESRAAIRCGAFSQSGGRPVILGHILRGWVNSTISPLGEATLDRLQ